MKCCPVFADKIRRYKPAKSAGVTRNYKATARTYFYENESSCEKNMETFLRCIEAVAGESEPDLQGDYL